LKRTISKKEVTGMPTAFSGSAFGAFSEFAVDGEPDSGKLIEIANSVVPFAKLAGVRVTELSADHAVAELPDSQDLKNHVGTVHAAAMYLAADVACAVAFIGAAPAALAQVEWTVVRGSLSTFLKPALGRIRAVGTVSERDMRAIARRGAAGRFDVDGRALLYDDNDVLVARFSFDYACQLAAPPEGS
jgi:acyl-coenzyme A thioesterase PaaI-like protein